jgi:hypothetical protein
MRRTIAFAVLAAISMGCAVQKTLVPTGGSRSDGTVKLSYTYGAFETPQVDMSQGRAAAAQRCAAWGYSDAEPFGGSTNICNSHDAYGSCMSTTVTIEYQCIGSPEAR